MCYHIRAVAKVNPEVKTRLLAEGTWNDFCLFRDNAQKEGNTPAAAERLAVAKFCPDLAGLPRVSHKKGANGKAKEAVSVPSTSISVAASVAKGLKAMTGVSLAVFEGKKCTMVEALDWVIDALALDPSQVVRQIPNGTRDEDSGGAKFAGEREYDMLAAMREEGVS